MGIGSPDKQRPLLIVELKKHAGADRRKVTEELLELGARHEHTRQICQVLFHPRFPVDVRHNAKIQRERLRAWAEQKLPGRAP